MFSHWFQECFIASKQQLLQKSCVHFWQFIFAYLLRISRVPLDSLALELRLTSKAKESMGTREIFRRYAKINCQKWTHNFCSRCVPIQDWKSLMIPRAISIENLNSFLRLKRKTKNLSPRLLFSLIGPSLLLLSLPHGRRIMIDSWLDSTAVSPTCRV